MTKLKSKKMTKSTFAVIVLSILMVAMLAFGGTYAYFTAVTGSKSAAVQTGVIKMNANTVTLSASNVVSGEDIVKGGSISVVNDKSVSNRGYWIFVTFSVGVFTAAEGGQPAGQAVASKAALAAEGDYFLDYSKADGWQDVDDGDDNAATIVYAYHVTDATAKTLDTITVCEKITFYGKSESTTSNAGSLMGKYVRVTIDATGIQDVLENGNGTVITEAQDAWDAAHPAQG